MNLITYKGLKILDATPAGAGGRAVQDNAVYIADKLETVVTQDDLTNATDSLNSSIGTVSYSLTQAVDTLTTAINSKVSSVNGQTGTVVIDGDNINTEINGGAATVTEAIEILNDNKMPNMSVATFREVFSPDVLIATSTDGYLDSSFLPPTLLSNLNASNLTSGTIPVARYSSAVARTDAVSNFGAFNYTFDTNVLAIDATNNRVGVGTTSPNSPLHIVGAAGSFGQLNIDSTASNAQSNFAISKGGTRQWVVYVPSGDDTFRWWGQTSGQDALILQQTGTVYTTGSNSSIGFKARDAAAIWVWYANAGVARLYSGSADTIAIDAATGNLGIGTSSGITSRLTLPAATTAAGGILFGETTLYRSGVNALTTNAGFFPQYIQTGYVYAAGGVNTVQFVNHCTGTNTTMNIGTGYGVGNHTNATIAISAANTFTSTSGTNAQLRISPTYNQASGTAANTDLLINRTQTAVGSGAQFLIDAQVGGTSQFNVTSAGVGYFAGNTVRVATARTPASATAAGTTGEICWDSSYVYVCVAANTWKRSAIATW